MTTQTTADSAATSQVVMDIARKKWGWMAEREMAPLEGLFHGSARFVHMGATMDRAAELDVIRGGQIQYKRADISEMTSEVIGDTVVVYTRMRLLAVVAGNEVSNPFSVTETYVRQDGDWKLAAMSFTRLLGD